MKVKENRLRLTSRQCNLINNSWRIMQEEAGIANPLIFYENFFKAVPEAEKYFSQAGVQDFKILSRKFINTMDFIIDNIYRLEIVKEEMRELGRVHDKIDIPQNFYPLFNQALIDLIEEVLGKRCTHEIKYSWKVALAYIVTFMDISSNTE